MTGLISIELTFSPPCHSSSNYLFLTRPTIVLKLTFIVLTF